MRILYIARSSIPSRWANSIQVMRMCQAFSQASVELELVLPFRYSALLRQPMNVFKLRQYYGVDFYFPIRFLPGPYIIRKTFTIDWFSRQAQWYAKLRHAHIVYTRTLKLAAVLVKQGLSVVVECHEYEFFRDNGDLSLLAQIADSALLKLIVVISEGLKRLYIEFGFPENKILVAHDGVDLSSLRASQDITFRSELGIPDTAPLICYTGKLAADRGLDLLIEAAAIIEEAYFVVIGGSPPEVQTWQRLAAAKKVSNVRFVGFVAPGEVAKYTLTSDVLVAPYTTRIPTVNVASPLKLFEYMATRRPIVVSSLPTIREVVTDRYDAILVGPDSVDALVEGLRYALTPAARQIGENAYRTVQKYTWQSRAHNILNALLPMHN